MAVEYIHKINNKIVSFIGKKESKKKKIRFQIAKFSTSILVSKIHISFIENKFTLKVSYKSQVYVIQDKHMRESTCIVNACTLCHYLRWLQPSLAAGAEQARHRA